MYFVVIDSFCELSAIQFQMLYSCHIVNTQKPKPFSGWFPLLGLYVAQVASGAAGCFTFNGAVHWVFALLFACLAAMWVVFDAQHRGKPLVSIVQLMVFCLWPIAVPIYLLAMRGVRGLGWLVLNVICLTIASVVGYYGTILVYWGPEAIWPPT